MKIRTLIGLLVACVLATTSHAVIVSFNYSQTDSTTGSGTIAPFSFAGHDFIATALPAATVTNPLPASTPAGFIGAQGSATGNSNEGNVAVGLSWSGAVTATSTDGFLIDIPLVFVPKQTQVPDVSDYTWNVVFGDSPANGIDTVSTSMRFAMYFSRDTLADGVETANTFQRYTQVNHTFAAGVTDTFTNTNTTTGAIKDATDAGAPAGTDAAGRDLAFYYGWRDQGALTAGAILIDDFTVGGLLDANEATLRPIPEPSSVLLFALPAAGLWRRRRS
jgi:hypothetical protein